MPINVMDVLRGDAFNMVSMSDESLQNVETYPQQLGAKKLTMVERIRTASVMIESYDGTLQLVPITQRGEPLPKRKQGKRTVRQFETVRVGQGDKIRASELAFARDFGSEDLAQQALAEEMRRRQGGPDGLIPNCELTLEMMRLNMLRGLLVDTDGDVIEDFYDAFGIAKAPVLNIDFANLSEGALRELIEDKVGRHMKRNAKGARYNRIGAEVGEGTWNALMKNPEFRETYKIAQEGNKLRESTLQKTIHFAGVDWEEYFGTDDNTTVAMEEDEIRFYPTGGNMFREVIAPGESFPDQGQLGKDWYSRVIPDDKRDEFVELEAMTYRLYVPTRLAMLVEGRAV